MIAVQAWLPPQRLTPLGPRHRNLIRAHLMSLSQSDRADRFAGGVNEEFVARYAEQICHGQDLLLGVIEAGKLIGLAHVPMFLDEGVWVAEVGLSVDAGHKRKGLGRQLLQAAIHAVRGLGAQRAWVQFRSANAAMVALSRSLGGSIETDGAESTATFAIDAIAEPRRGGSGLGYSTRSTFTKPSTLRPLRERLPT